MPPFSQIENEVVREITRVPQTPHPLNKRNLPTHNKASQLRAFNNPDLFLNKIVIKNNNSKL
ncbi:hypothetical protein GCM10011389_18300 [Pontibacillus salipaludis]|uniref:Uncharacterized protein n=1 Tax=Pontibacillus salipaludis TaxID=1697394 RepID=A0ABQ1Q254_9BACI|nr:hypothetical protein GCM10011389_18300 [Pontibacillus salipaludis]